MSNIGHNSGINAPTEQEVLDDLKARYGDIETRQAEFEEALKEYPKDLGLEDADRAAALQDLLGQIADQKSIVAGRKKTEKGPWDKVVKVVTNLFATADEKLAALQAEWKPVHQAYLDKVKAEKIRKQEEEAQRQREKEETARKEAEAAEARAAEAKAAEEEARRREEKARADQAAAEAAKKKAEEEAAAAAAREKQLAEERKKRDRAEKDQNEDALRAIKRHMKDVDRLQAGAIEAGDEVAQNEIDQLDALIRPGGIISVLAGPVADSALLDDEQRTEIEGVRARLGELRAAAMERLGAREKRRRAKEQAEADAKEKAAGEERARKRAADEAAAKVAREAREKAEGEADAARKAGETAKGEVREARADARGAAQDQKSATRAAGAATTEADRAANRADKIEDRLENATDAEIAGTLRGDLGTKGSLTRNWTLRIVDEEALRAVLGPLGPHFTEDALNGAAYRWMRAHQAGWSGRERVEGELAGVVFAYQQGSRIA